jgi:MFS transporter, ACS family, D-galactonate transporter
VGLLSIALAFAYTYRTNIAFVLASREFVGYLRLTDSDRGTLTSAFFWTYGLLQIPAGALVDRFGAKWPLAAGLFMWCILSAAQGMANAFASVLVLRLFLGLTEAVVTPAGLRWIRDNFEESERGMATGIFFAGSKYGPAVAAPVAAYLINQHGWRSMFVYQGLAGLLWLAPWLVLARGTHMHVQPRAGAGPEPPFSSVFTSRIMWGTLIGTFCYNYFVFYALSWLPAYFVEQHHLSLTSSGIYSGFSYGGMAAVAILAGMAADRMIARGCDAVVTRRGFIVAGLLLSSTIIFGAFAESANGAIFFSILSMAGLGLATANYWSLPQTVMPKAMAGRVGGAQNLALTLAGILAPLVTGWLKQITGSYSAPIAAVGVVMIIGVGAYLFLVRRPAQNMVPAAEPV